MKRHLLYISLLLTSFCSLGQDLSSAINKSQKLFEEKQYSEATPILQKAIENHTEDSSENLVEAILLLARIHMHSWQQKEAFGLYNKAWKISQNIDNDSLLIESGFNYMTMLSLNHKTDSVSIISRQLLALDNLDYKTISNLNLNLANYHEVNESVDSAIFYGTIATQIDSIHQDSSSIPFSFYDLGNYYITNFEYEKGISKILYGLDFVRGERDVHKKNSIELGLCDIYYKIGNIPKAQELATQALNSAIKHGHQISQCYAYNVLGNCAAYMDDYEKALIYYQKSDSTNQSKSKNLFRSVRAKTSIITQKMNLGITIDETEINKIVELCKGKESNLLKNKLDFLLLRTSNYSQDKFDSEYERLLKESGASENIHLKRSLLKIKKQYLYNQKKYKESISIGNEINKINKDVTLKNNKYIIQDLEAKHRKKEQNIQISYLDQQNTDKGVILEEQRKKIIFGSIALGLIALLSFFLFRLYHQVKSQKEIITKALSEKDLLLREIHHRVKNNLQLVSSLLTMQGRSINDETAIQAINEGKSRVRSMAIIHQDLYNKENLTGISVKSYIEKLTQELFSTYRIDDNKIDLQMKVEDIELDVDTIVPLGLIINELITNSLKYAWPNDIEGTLLIELKKTESQIVLTVKDDGIGYDPTTVREGSFGATLISALTLQLEGECTVSTDNGSTVVISIDLDE